MAINTSVVTRNIGPANVYVDCTVPADLTPIALGAGGVPTGGRDIGATQGESAFTYTPDIQGVEIEQVQGMVAPHLVSEQVELTCTMMERTYANLLVALGQGTGSTSGGVNKISLGDKLDVPTRAVALVAKAADQATYDVALIYQAVVMGGVQLAWKRGEARGVQVTFRGIPVHSRSAGDQLAQFLDDALAA